MPPVMGAVAFIMAETLNVPYVTIVKAAVIPAFLYYLTAFCMVHLEAGRKGLHGLPKADCPNPWHAIRDKWYLMLPLAVLVFMLFDGFTPMFFGHRRSRADRHADSRCRHRVRFRLDLVQDRLLDSARTCHGQFLQIRYLAVNRHDRHPGGDQFRHPWWPCNSRHHARKHDRWCKAGDRRRRCLRHRRRHHRCTHAYRRRLEFRKLRARRRLEEPLLSLFLTMAVCLVLGMGIPTIPNYIITSAIAAPALLTLKVPLIVSHMFVFYFGIMADLTPPVALAAFAAASIAKASPMRIGWKATHIAIAGFVIPYMAVYDPALMLQGGTWLDTAYVVFKAIVAIVLWGSAAASATCAAPSAGRNVLSPR